MQIWEGPAAAKLLQLCLTLWDPIDSSPPGSPVSGILQARTLEWVAISFSSAWKWKVKVKLLSCVWLLATPWTAAYQAPPSMGFSRQEYWSGVPLPSPWEGPSIQHMLKKKKILTTQQQKDNPIKIWKKDLVEHLPKDGIQMASNRVKRCSTSLVIREMQIKTTVRYYFTSARAAII